MNEVLEVRPRESGRGSSDFSIAGDRPSRSSRLAYPSKASPDWRRWDVCPKRLKTLWRGGRRCGLIEVCDLEGTIAMGCRKSVQVV